MEKRIVYKFYADWCGPCRMVQPVYQRVMDELKDENIEFVGINTSEDPLDLKKKYEVKSIPYFVLMDSDHNVIRTKSGFMRENDLRNFILE